MAEICFQTCVFARNCKNKAASLEGQLDIFRQARLGALQLKLSGIAIVSDYADEVRELNAQLWWAENDLENVQNCPGPNQTVNLGSRAVSYVCRHPSAE